MIFQIVIVCQGFSNMALTLLKRTICLKKDVSSCVLLRRLLSSEIDLTTTQEDSLRYYRTEENNPLNHDQKHFGRLYTVRE